MTQNDVNFGLLHNNTESLDDFSLRELIQNARRGILVLGRFPVSVRQPLIDWIAKTKEVLKERYNTHLYNENLASNNDIPLQYNEKQTAVDGRIVLRDNFDALFLLNTTDCFFLVKMLVKLGMLIKGPKDFKRNMVNPEFLIQVFVKQLSSAKNWTCTKGVSPYRRNTIFGLYAICTSYVK